MTVRTIGILGRVLDQADGLGVFSRHVIRQLLTLDPASRYLVFLTTPRAAGVFSDFPNAQAVVLPSGSRLMWDQVLVPRAARRLGVDLLFNPKFSVPLFSSIPSVFILQSCDWYVNPRNYPWWDNLYIRLTLPLYCRKASGLLAISQATLDQLTRHTGMKFARTGITHAGIGANFNAQGEPAEREQFRKEYKLPPRFILTVARVLHTGHSKLPPYPGGNNERLLRAYRHYRQQTSEPLPLVVIGRAVQEYLRARGFTDSDFEGVVFPGFVPNERIHAAYQLADCFVLATLCESFGLPILEALACGCPAIVPATCAGPEVAGSAARLIDPYDEDDITRALLEVTGSERLREQLRRDGLERAARFTWQRTARRVLDLFDEILPTAPAALKRSELMR